MAGEVIERLDVFPGIGAKTSHMACRQLFEDGVGNFARWDQINVAVVHIRRVWKRVGLCQDDRTSDASLALRRLPALASDEEPLPSSHDVQVRPRPRGLARPLTGLVTRLPRDGTDR
jgi:hypothetical protein